MNWARPLLRSQSVNRPTSDHTSIVADLKAEISEMSLENITGIPSLKAYTTIDTAVKDPVAFIPNREFS
jgi:hypothetical protein